MRAVTHPAPDALVITDRPDPLAGEGQVVVQVHATALNRADLLQRAGKYPAPPGWPADVPGLEYAGTVIALGEGVTRWREGDRVMGLVGGGGHAERVVVDELEAVPIPERLSFTDAAAIPEAFLTAWDALVLRARCSAGERVLMHAAASGVGTAAIQVALLLGVTLIGTSRTAEKLKRCTALGMPFGVLTTDDAWPASVGDAVDIVIDTLGAASFSQSLGLLNPRGRLVVLGTMTGARVPDLDLSHVLRKRLEIIGTAMRSRSLSERVELVARFGDEVLPRFADGTLRPVIDQVFPMDEIELAHAAMRENRTFGKVVLVW